MVSNWFFGGVALRHGPVRPILAAGGDLLHGIGELSTSTLIAVRGPIGGAPGADTQPQPRLAHSTRGTWVKAPGCYGWQVDGLTFSEVIDVDAVLPAGLAGPST